jgi:nicotinamidase/pyrazinamidase
MAEGLKPSDSDVFLVVDVQNDFCPGGALAVPEGEAVVPVINDLAKGFKNVVMTQDWHPPGHSSFASSHPGKQPFETTTLDYGEQTLWPDHCVQGSTGAAFRADLDLPNCRMIIRKGDRREVDSYSAFYENDHRTTTGLAGYLRAHGVRRVFLAGLATDFCVFYSALDARKEGFEAVMIEDACRAIDLAGSLEAARRAMDQAGVLVIRSSDLG